MYDNLQQFIKEWKILPKAKPLNIVCQKPIQYEELRSFFNEFSTAYEKLQSSGVMTNVWEISGLKRDEVRNSSVLSWFLSANSNHGLKGDLCAVLLDKMQNIIKTNDKHQDFPTKDSLKEGEEFRYQSTPEVCPIDRDNRVDIVLDGKNILLYIEVKIDAPQGEQQLHRYHNLAKNCHRGRKWGVVYLTPRGGLPDDAQTLENCMAISWLDVSHVFKKYSKSLEYDHLSRHYLEQFSDYVTQF